MYLTIYQTADCDIRNEICFLTVRNVSAADINLLISEVYRATLPWVAAECVNEWEHSKMDGEMSMINCDQSAYQSSHKKWSGYCCGRKDHDNSRFKLLANGISK